MKNKNCYTFSLPKIGFIVVNFDCFKLKSNETGRGFDSLQPPSAAENPGKEGLPSQPHQQGVRNCSTIVESPGAYLMCTVKGEED